MFCTTAWKIAKVQWSRAIFSPFQSINVGKIGSFALAEIGVMSKQICPIIDKMYERL